MVGRLESEVFRRGGRPPLRQGQGRLSASFSTGFGAGAGALRSRVRGYWEQACGDGGDDFFVDFFNGEVAFDEDDAGRFAEGDLEIFLPDAAVEGVVFRFKAGFVGAGLGGYTPVAASGAGKISSDRGFKRGQEQEGEVGLEVGAEDAVELEDGSGAKLAATALVGFRGVGEAVAEDDFAGGEGGLNDFGDGLSAVGKHEGQFSQWREAGLPGVEHQGADAVTGEGSAGLAEEDDAAAEIAGFGSEPPFDNLRAGIRQAEGRLRGGRRLSFAFFEPGGQAPDLRGFAGTIETFKGDKETTRHGVSLSSRQKN